MSNVDVPVQLHFALFNGTCGFVLKPPKMRPTSSDAPADERGSPKDKEDDFWPPPRDRLYRTTLELLSLHQLPKVLARRCYRC